MKPRTSLQKTLRGHAFTEPNTGQAGHYKRSDNSDKDPFTKAKNWTKPEYWFWENDLYSEESKQYFRRFVAEQAKIADRKAKGG